MKETSKKMSFSGKLTESAIMLALATVLSYFKLIDLPYGGSVTLCSMLPMVVVAYRHGLGWGLGAGLANGILQLIFGLSNLSYATSAAAAVAIIMLDYIVAFAVTGFGGIFKKITNSKSGALCLGTIFACVLRYICHVISGCTVWAGVSIPDSQAIIYSLGYNATYMLPELLITVAGAFYLADSLNLEGVNITRIKTEEKAKSFKVLDLLGVFALIVAFITDIVLIAPGLQNPESGNFDITGLAGVNFLTVGIVSAVAVVIFAALKIYVKKNR